MYTQYLHTSDGPYLINRLESTVINSRPELFRNKEEEQKAQHKNLIDINSTPSVEKSKTEKLTARIHRPGWRWWVNTEHRHYYCIINNFIFCSVVAILALSLSVRSLILGRDYFSLNACRPPRTQSMWKQSYTQKQKLKRWNSYSLSGKLRVAIATATRISTMHQETLWFVYWVSNHNIHLAPDTYG